MMGHCHVMVPTCTAEDGTELGHNSTGSFNDPRGWGAKGKGFAVVGHLEQAAGSDAATLMHKIWHP